MCAWHLAGLALAPTRQPPVPIGTSRPGGIAFRDPLELAARAWTCRCAGGSSWRGTHGAGGERAHDCSGGGRGGSPIGTSRPGGIAGDFIKNDIASLRGTECSRLGVRAPPRTPRSPADIAMSVSIMIDINEVASSSIASIARRVTFSYIYAYELPAIITGMHAAHAAPPTLTESSRRRGVTLAPSAHADCSARGGA